MTVESLPSKVVRIGGTVQTLEEPNVAYKKISTSEGPTVATLCIPQGEQVVYPEKESGSWNNTKLRVSGAITIDLENSRTQGYSLRDMDTKYSLGAYTRPHEFDDDTSTVDAPGLHCFPNREAAVHWHGYES